MAEPGEVVDNFPVCELCDTVNARGCTECEECGHNPYMARGADSCYACVKLGFSSPPSSGQQT